MTDEEKVRRLLSAGMLDDADEFRRCFDGALRDARAKALEEADGIAVAAYDEAETEEVEDAMSSLIAKIRALKVQP